MSHSLQPHGLQHARLPCPSLSPRVCSHSCPLNPWCYLIISSSVTPFFFCFQSFPASGSFPVSQLFALGGQSIGTSSSVSVLPMNIQGWFPSGLTGLISLQPEGLSRVFSRTNSLALSLLYGPTLTFVSVQFSCSVVSDSLQPCEPQHARPPCPSPTPEVHQNPCPLCRWCHPTISSSVVPFSSCPQSFQASGSFQMSQLSASGGQSIGVSATTSVLPMNTQDWSPLGWTGWISLQSKGLSRVFSNTTVQKHQSSALSFLYRPTLTSIHDYWKNNSLD